MSRRPASVPDLCIFSRSSDPNEGVSFVLSCSRASCMAVRVASDIWPLVLIHTSVVMECVTNSSFPSRHHPLCRLHLPSALATICDSLKGGLSFVACPLWMGEEDQVVCCGEGRDQFLVVEAQPMYDHWLWSRDFFSPDSFLSSSCVFEEGWDGKGGIRAVSPWYLVAWKTPFIVRNNFQEKDLCFFPLSSFNCRVSSFCRLTPSVLGLAFVKVCLRRCHCSPSMTRGPHGSWIVDMPCVVTT